MSTAAASPTAHGEHWICVQRRTHSSGCCAPDVVGLLASGWCVLGVWCLPHPEVPASACDLQARALCIHCHTTTGPCCSARCVLMQQMYFRV
jgi:hypothetical protein